jgi:hypothetical protein
MRCETKTFATTPAESISKCIDPGRREEEFDSVSICDLFGLMEGRYECIGFYVEVFISSSAKVVHWFELYVFWSGMFKKIYDTFWHFIN